MARLSLCPRLVARQERGFTLVELMIVVIIVGVLATIAVLGYRKMVNSSHVTEATSMVNSLRVAQEAYHSETQSYAPCMASIGGGGNWYPSNPKYSVMTAWGAPCGGKCQAGYDISVVLPVHVDGPVLFGYETTAGVATANPSGNIANTCNLTISVPATDWYAIGAEADLDGNSSNTTDVCAVSFSNQIFVVNEGL